MSLPVQVAQGHNSQVILTYPNVPWSVQSFSHHKVSIWQERLSSVFFDGSLRHWLQAFVFVFVTWGKTHPPGYPTWQRPWIRQTVWRSRDGITGSAELQRNLCFCRGTIFAEIKGLIAARWYPQLCEDRKRSVSVQPVLGAWGYVKNPSATPAYRPLHLSLFGIPPWPKLWTIRASCASSLMFHDQRADESGCLKRQDTNWQSASGWSRMFGTKFMVPTCDFMDCTENTRKLAAWRLIPDQPKS